MRVALCTHNFPPALGGMATLHHQYAEALTAAGHAIEVHVWGTRGRGEPFPFPVRYHAGPAWLATRRLPGLARADLVWTAFGEPLPLKLALCPALAALGRPFFLFAGGRILRHSRRGWKARTRQVLVRRLLATARAVFTDGQDVREELIAAGVAAGKITVLYSGVHPARFSPEQTTEPFERHLAEQGRALPPQPRLLFLGRLAEENGPLSFLRLVERFPQVGALLLGDGPLRAQVEAAAARLGERVLVAGRVERALLGSALAAADLCAFPLSSLHGGIPLAVMEAMAAGRACIAHRVGDLARLVNGENGVLVEANEDSALSGAVEELLREPARRAEMGRRAAEMIRRDWSLEQAQARFVRAVERLAGD